MGVLTATHFTHVQEIEEGMYRAIIVSPEKILTDKHFDNLWANKKFLSKLFNMSIDEGHCISQWGREFRPEYANLGQLRYILPDHVHFHIVSATMPNLILSDVRKQLRMNVDTTTMIRCSNNRANIQYVVERNETPGVHILLHPLKIILCQRLL